MYKDALKSGYDVTSFLQGESSGSPTAKYGAQENTYVRGVLSRKWEKVIRVRRTHQTVTSWVTS